MVWLYATEINEDDLFVIFDIFLHFDLENDPEMENPKSRAASTHTF